MLFPGRRLHRGIHLSGYAQIRKGAEAGVSAAVIIPDGLEQPYHPLLDQIVAVPAQKIHGFGFCLDHPFIFFHDVISDVILAVTKKHNQFFITIFPVGIFHWEIIPF